VGWGGGIGWDDLVRHRIREDHCSRQSRYVNRSAGTHSHSQLLATHPP
jgi:hypothetical protein